jgi:hypothetical protein
MSESLREARPLLRALKLDLEGNLLFFRFLNITKFNTKYYTNKVIFITINVGKWYFFLIFSDFS